MQQQDLNLFETGLDETAKAHLLETTRWTKFIGICAILILILFSAYTLFTMRYLSAAMANSGNSGVSDFGGVAGIVSTITILVMIALYFYPIYALLRFSSYMKKGILSNNQELINEGFRYQKNMFRYTGILLIISLVTILLSFIIGGAGVLTGA